MKSQNPLTRRELLTHSAVGLGALYSVFLGSVPQTLGDTQNLNHPLAPKQPHFTPRAKRVIFLYQTGGASHVDSFDPKEKLYADHGKSTGSGNRILLASPWESKPHGKSGLMVTDLFPHVASVIDDICLIRSMHGDQGDHFQATLQMHNGSNGLAMPSIGAWLSYALGTENPNLPSHVVFSRNKPYAGSQIWDSNFLPDYHQGVHVQPGDNPIPNIFPNEKTAPMQIMELEMLKRVNQQHYEQRKRQTELAARMLSFQTAYNMQTIAPGLFDYKKESDATLEMYGLKRGDNTSYAWQCLMARRMAEKGVRFIEIIDTGSSRNWDAHGDIKSHAPLAKAIDQPIAALIKDLKQRGMYKDTLMVWCTEFGRTPQSDGKNPKGRGHHRSVFTCWLAGGAVKGGTAYGASDEIGNGIAENPVHIHDFHATILHIMGLDHERLTYHHNGRDFRLTDVHGKVIHNILA